MRQVENMQNESVSSLITALDDAIMVVSNMQPLDTLIIVCIAQPRRPPIQIKSLLHSEK